MRISKSKSTEEQQLQFKRLRRQLGEKCAKLYDQGYCGGRIRHRSSASYNTCLRKMKEFLRTLNGDYTNHTFMKEDYLD